LVRRFSSHTFDSDFQTDVQHMQGEDNSAMMTDRSNNRSNNRFDSDDFEDLDTQYNPLNSDRKSRRKRKPRVHHTPKKSERDQREEVADLDTIEGGFKLSYTPARFEEGWLLSSLQPFFDQTLINDVLARVRGGKEASVYRCAADPSTGETLLAAKVYRPRIFRTLRNDAMYREGRAVMTADGKTQERDQRIKRAMQKKSAFGAEVAHTSWLMYEYNTLKLLYEAGAAVPKPFAVAENAILMGYVGDEGIAAPILHEVRLERAEAVPLFHEVMRNIEIMLQHHLVHGDLSAYNMLFWEGEITIIDFPQVINTVQNRNAREVLYRDIERVCQYFQGQGVRCNPRSIMEKLWTRYVQADYEARLHDEIIQLEE
jgi:RIO kinase 1